MKEEWELAQREWVGGEGIQTEREHIKHIIKVCCVGERARSLMWQKCRLWGEMRTINWLEW